AAHFLLADCCSPLGRWAAAAEHEATRAGLAPPPVPARAGQFCQALGLQRLSYPRRQAVRRVAAVCLQTIVRRWMSKDTGPVEAAARDWVAKQWRDQELGAEHFIARVQLACEKSLGKSPEAAFAAALEGLGLGGTPRPVVAAAAAAAERGGARTTA